MNEELEKFLKNNPELRFVDVLLPDICNIVRGKRIPRDDLAKVYGDGLQVPSSIYLLDVNGRGTDAGGRGFSDGDPDVKVRPVPGSLNLVPWGPPGAGQVLGSLYELDDSACPVDPRHVLSGVVERLRESGLHPVVALELEFYLIDAASADEGRPRPPVLPDTGRRASATQVYSLADLDGFTRFLSEVETTCQAQGVPLGATTAEYAVGQYEINLQHVEDPLRAADHAILLRRAVQGLARGHDAVATFMAKPYPEDAGNGLHVHVSVLDDKGHNVFDNGSSEGSIQLRHAVAGMLDLLPQSMAVFAPNVNSYRRFAPNLYVPTGPTWGYNNRSVAVRIPAGDNTARRIEHRMAGADANPYLTLAAVLAGLHHGISHGLAPPDPRTDNAGTRLDSAVPFTWQGALDELAKPSALDEYLGAEYLSLYRQCKQFELDTYAKEFTPLEYRWYLAPE